MVISRVPESQRGTHKTSSAVALLLVLAVVIGVWLINGRDPGTATSARDDTSSPSAPGLSTSDTPSTEPTTEPTTSPTTSPTTEPTDPPATQVPSTQQPGEDFPDVDPDSGLPVVLLADLPPEAADTIDLIDAGGPYPYDQDGGTFGNYEGLLPDYERGYYQEFTVETPGSRDRGARRIIEGAEGELYWTDDHYASFSAIYY